LHKPAHPYYFDREMSSDILDLDPQNRYRPAKGRLLVSGPYLPDPYFRRTVVLLCDHTTEGSFGFVLNRHMEMNVSDLVDNMPPIGSKVSIGGPVQSGDLYYLHTLGPHIEGSQEIVDGIYMGGEYDQLRAILTTDPKLSRHVRFFVGYSGWASEQLEKELEEKSWLVTPADRKVIMNVRSRDLWGETLRTMGKEFAPLANFPEDPSLN
jgi:putative transcriptional regulator